MSLSEKLCQNLNKIWADQELCDFTVEIDDVSIRCHRVILGASSPFFLRLLRSGMKETNEGHVVLQDISVSTFQLILKTLYTGEDVLSLDNFIEIWHAVDMLQIGFLVEHCETFAAKNIKLENFRRILSVANLFNSKSVLSSVKTFMTQNIEAIYTDKLYLELSFDEMCFVVSSHGLHFNSEDPVLEMVLNWAENKPVVKDFEAINYCTGNNKKFKTSEPVNRVCNANLKYTPPKCSEDKSTTESNSNENQLKCVLSYDSNAMPVRLCDNTNSTSVENLSTDRFDQLNILLTLVRTCIISPSLLVNFLEHRLIKRNDKARQIIVSAILKQTSFRHGQWPTAGIYRQFHEYGNFCVTYVNDTGKFLLIDPFDEKRYTIKSCPRLRHNTKLCAFDKELYATSGHFAGRITSDMFVYRDNSWTQLDDIPGAVVLLASNDQYIYIIALLINNVFRLKPKSNPPKDDFFYNSTKSVFCNACYELPNVSAHLQY
ncbi:kelch-like protein 8 [Physella acuta]|uniref:kelch-like protein 8 n=1 Tax=Physella acuta TaxID=109671 RepID=UPI0027DBDE93|nr:kelch-like protein 8 [Physella acuta]